MNKKLVGGDYLLDLTPITIEKSDDGNYTNITNKDVLSQLTNLKKYVKNPMMVKPVWVRFKNGETDELVVARGTFAVVDTGEFEICIFADGYKLKLHIEFTQAELEDHTPIDDWYIDTNDAKFIFTSDYKSFVVEDVKNIDGKILSQLQCGDVVIKHDESGEHSYVVTFKSETGICLTYTDASCIETQSYDYVDGTGWVYNSQDLSFINRIEQIVDKDGHQRFIEGDITSLGPTGFTRTYGKWSLSGTHLMIVLAFNVASGTILEDQALGELTLPEWVYNKIVALWGANGIAMNEFLFITTGADYQYKKVYIGKSNDNKLRLSIYNDGESVTLTSNKAVRISFDLLIDNA